MHSSQVFENYIRSQLGAQRYWESEIEFDAIRRNKNKLEVYEIKFSKLTSSAKNALINKLKLQWEKGQLHSANPHPQYIVFDLEALVA